MVLEMKLSEYVKLSNFKKLPDDVKSLFLMMSETDDKYVIRISDNHMEIGYPNDRFYGV